MKPALIGTISPSPDGNCAISYRIQARAFSLIDGAALWCAFVLLIAAGFALSGTGHAEVFLLAVAAIFAAICISFVVQADQGIQEEALLLDWISTELKPSE
jgi:hypothetical protein